MQTEKTFDFAKLFFVLGIMSNLPFPLPNSWMQALKDELSKPYMLSLRAFLEHEYRTYPKEIFPREDEIFSSFTMTPFEKVRVVLIGQDPYHGEGQAHGLSFSVKPGVKLPPSLQNIYKELRDDLGITPTQSGFLASWAEAGVLMLNATLTVRKNQPLSHHNKGWEQFTDACVRALLEKKEHLVFILWGKNAQKKCRQFPEEVRKKHLILEAAHPSPYSAHQGFFGCRHFSKTNAYLKEHQQAPIPWESVFTS